MIGKNTLPFAYDQVIIAHSKDKLHRQVFYFAKHNKRFWNGNITREIGYDGVSGQDPVRVKRLWIINVYSKSLRYLGYEIYYVNQEDIQ